MTDTQTPPELTNIDAHFLDPMSKPRRALIRMFLFILLIIALLFALSADLIPALFANLALNSVILAVLVIGIVYILRQVWMLGPEVEWVERYRRGQDSLSRLQPKLLGPMSAMLGNHNLTETRGTQKLAALSPTILGALLDTIQSRLEEKREIARYLISLLVFLGLLGTFWGLLTTVSSVGDALATLDFSDKQDQDIFASLKSSLEQPLDGMGTAFSSSLFGLAGSLILGFLEILAGQAQNRFTNELEEWLSAITRLPLTPLAGQHEEGALTGGSAYLIALLEQSVDASQKMSRALEALDKDQQQNDHHDLQQQHYQDTFVQQFNKMQKANIQYQEQNLRLLNEIIKRADSQDHKLSSLQKTLQQNSLDLQETYRQETRLLAKTLSGLRES